MTDPFTRLRRLRHSSRWLYGTMLVSACLSLTASFVLSIDAVRLAANPQQTLSCDINSVISCSTVANSWQANLLGFPNAFLGLVTEPVVITIAVAGLGGVRFPRWFMFTAQIAYTIGLILAHWLLYQSMFHIGALCPWCLLVTASTTLVFSTLTHINIRHDNLRLPTRIRSTLKAAIIADLDAIAVTIWLLTLTLILISRYGHTLFA